MRTRPANRRGFTLIEVLAGLAVSAMAILALTFAVGIAARAWSRGDVDTELTEKVGRAASRFNDDVGSLMPWRYAAGSDPQIVFAGDRREVVFAAMAQTGAYGSPRLRLVSYRFLTTERGSVVQRRVAPIPIDPGRPETADWGDAVAVIAGVDSPALAYAESPGKWVDLWTPGATLPTAVRLTFLMRGRTVVLEAPVLADPIRDCQLPTKALACPDNGDPPAPENADGNPPPPVPGQ